MFVLSSWVISALVLISSAHGGNSMVESSQLALLPGFELEQALSLLCELDCVESFLAILKIPCFYNSINSPFCKEDMRDTPNDQVLFVASPQL